MVITSVVRDVGGIDATNNFGIGGSGKNSGSSTGGHHVGGTITSISSGHVGDVERSVQNEGIDREEDRGLQNEI